MLAMLPEKPVTDYQVFLLQELETRTQKNPAYSLRAFARDLGISPSRLSELLHRKTGLSRLAALKIAERLRLSESNTTLFVTLVEQAHARSALKRAAATKRLERLGASSYEALEGERFEAISDWICLALMELVRLPAFKEVAPQDRVSWAAAALRADEAAISQALNKLIELGFLEQRGRTLAPKRLAINPAGRPSAPVRRFHRQILERSAAALETQDSRRRDSSALVLALDPAKLDEARALTKRFRAEMDALLSSPNSDRVYCLTVQLFELSEGLHTA